MKILYPTYEDHVKADGTKYIACFSAIGNLCITSRLYFGDKETYEIWEAHDYNKTPDMKISEQYRYSVGVSRSLDGLKRDILERHEYAVRHVLACHTDFFVSGENRELKWLQ